MCHPVGDTRMSTRVEAGGGAHATAMAVAKAFNIAGRGWGGCSAHADGAMSTSTKSGKVGVTTWERKLIVGGGMREGRFRKASTAGVSEWCLRKVPASSGGMANERPFKAVKLHLGLGVIVGLGLGWGWGVVSGVILGLFVGAPPRMISKGLAHW